MFNMISIVIPCHNSERSLKQCLDSVFLINCTANYEVIIVDDASGDQTVAIAKNYPCRIFTLRSNNGAAYARNYGAKEAIGELLVFIDSDVVVKSDILTLFLGNYSRDQVDGVVGFFAESNPYSDYFSQYKSLYCYYKYCQLKNNDVSAFNTAVAAIKKSVFVQVDGFDESLSACEDNEFGERLFQNGFHIYIDNNIKVLHLKQFTFLSLLRNDYRKSVSLSEILFSSIKKKGLPNKLKFSDFSYGMMINIPIVFSLLVAILFCIISNSVEGLIIVCLLWSVFLFNNRKFFNYLLGEKGLWFVVKAAFFTVLDYAVVGAAVLKGMIVVLFKL